MASIPEGRAHPDNPGIDGYELGPAITRGLAGLIRQGRHRERGLDVAIELIEAPLADDEGFRRRLTDETVPAALLDHPSIVRLYETTESDRVVGVVTECFAGTNVSALLRSDTLEPPAACYVADAVLLALLVAHRAGVLHGDVRGDAVIIDRGRVRLGGFAVGRALRPELPADAATDTYGLARLTVALMSGSSGEMPALPRHLRRVLDRGTTRRVDHRYRTASGLRTALAGAARHDIGPDWREVAAGELAALISGAPAAEPDAPPVAPPVLHKLPVAPPPAASPAPAPAPPPRRDEADRTAPPPVVDQPAVAPQPPVGRRPEPARPAALAPVITAAPSGFRRRRRRLSALTGFALVAAAIVVGLLGGVVVSAMRGGGGVTSDPLSVGRPVTVQIQPAMGTCNSVFVATARGPVRGQGTLVYRWERSDGLQSEDTRLAVPAGDSFFLVTEHWQLSGQISHPRITFHLVDPVAVTVTAPITYTCP